MQKPIAVQLYSVREAAGKDFPGVLKRIAAFGYAGVEFAGLHNFSPKAIAKVIKDLGLAASSAHVALPSRDNLAQIVDEAKTLGYNTLVTGFGPDDMKTEDGVQACIDKFTHACQMVKSHGLMLAMHNHWWEFDRRFAGKTPYELILTAVPDLASELDIYWSTKGGADTAQVVKAWAKRIPLLHVKDGDLTEKIVHKAVGEGKVPVKSIVPHADPKVLQWLVVELDACETDMFEAVEKSLKWLIANGLGTGKAK